MAVLAQTITQRASRTLLDESRVAWTTSEILDYLNAGIRALCLIRPDAYTVVGPVSMVAGVLQSLPADANMLIRPLYNLNGKPVRHTGLDAMTASSDWVTASPNRYVTTWAADSRDRTRFFVSPPNDGTGTLVCFYAAFPPPITSESSTIPVQDMFETPLWAYVCSMMYAKNSLRQDMEKSKAMMQMFMSLITGGAIAGDALFPDLKKIEQGQK